MAHRRTSGAGAHQEGSPNVVRYPAATMTEDESTDPGCEFDNAWSSRCQHCGGDIRASDRVSRVGGLETYRCPRCDGELHMTVSYAFDYLPPSPHPYFTVVLDWDPNLPPSSVVDIVRALVPQLDRLPGVIAGMVQDGPPLAGPVLVEPEADALIAAVEAAGLRASKRPPDLRPG